MRNKSSLVSMSKNCDSFLCESKTHPLCAVSLRFFRLYLPKAAIIPDDSIHQIRLDCARYFCIPSYQFFVLRRILVQKHPYLIFVKSRLVCCKENICLSTALQGTLLCLQIFHRFLNRGRNSGIICSVIFYHGNALFSAICFNLRVRCHDKNGRISKFSESFLILSSEKR